ncbi:MAG: thioredoxin family protein [Mycobacteriales bacterium]|nr:thioredoxin family protein [Mycobacteriales bacterium]
MEGLVALAAVLALSTVAGLVHRRRQGRMRDLKPTGEDLRGLVRELGGEPGETATLLQFSSAFCAPCRATRRTLEEVSAMVPGVTHVEVDAEKHLDVVRRLGILKTPTTLVLDRDGRVTTRAAGQPRKPDVIAALGKAVPS